MPRRKTPLVTKEVYHVFNRIIASIPIFERKRECSRFLFAMSFYQNIKPPLKLSKFNKLSKNEKHEISELLYQKREWFVEIISYCLMPNHFHIVVKQLVDDGVKNYLRLVSDSFAHYFNIKNDRGGPLFESRFKAVRIEKDAQLLHVVRYIHLNPYSSYLVKNLEDLGQYPFSSFPEYIGKAKKEICQKRLVLDHFKIYGKYKEFVFNQADFQKSLAKIKHTLMD